MCVLLGTHTVRVYFQLIDSMNIEIINYFVKYTCQYFKYLYLILVFKNYKLIICILLYRHTATSLTFKIGYNLYCSF